MTKSDSKLQKIWTENCEFPFWDSEVAVCLLGGFSQVFIASEHTATSRFKKNGLIITRLRFSFLYVVVIFQAAMGLPIRVPFSWDCPCVGTRNRSKTGTGYQDRAGTGAGTEHRGCETVKR